MKIWALADLHLSFGVPAKSMKAFGWGDYEEKLERLWKEMISEDDLVLLPGDISWAMRMEDAMKDLQWIDRLPGTKVMIRGNHDYWWSSLSKVRASLPPSIHALQNDAFLWNDVAISGARLWDTPEYDFSAYIEFRENPQAAKEEPQPDPEKIFERELQRLELSLKNMKPNAALRICMTHYPPISADLQPSRASALLEKYKVDLCVFGHLHSLKANQKMFGTRGCVRYYLASIDYLDFVPLRLPAVEE